LANFIDRLTSALAIMLKLPRAAKQKDKYQKSANEQLQKNNIRVLFVPSTLRRALENLS